MKKSAKKKIAFILISLIIIAVLVVMNYTKIMELFTESYKGIDVSYYQGDIDWAAVAKDKVDFVFVRAGYRGYTEGNLFLDKNYLENVTNAKENGLDVGIYFVTQAINAEEAKEEALFVLENIDKDLVNYPVVLDMEPQSNVQKRADGLSKDERTDIILAFCEVIEDGGFQPMVYSSARFFAKELDLPRLSDIKKWIAYYTKKPVFPATPSIWQYSNEGRVDGIKTNVDLNISYVNFSKEVEGLDQETL